MTAVTRKPAGTGSFPVYGEPDRASVPPGGLTVEGLLARSDPRIGKRYADLQLRSTMLASDHGDRWKAMERAKDARDHERGVLARYEVARREARDSKAAEALDARIASQRLKVEQAEALFEKQNAAVHQTTIALSAYRGSLEVVTKFLQSRAGQQELKVVEVNIEEPASGKYDEVVLAKRAEGAQTKAAMESVKDSPPLKESVLKAIRRQVTTLAEDGRPSISGLYYSREGDLKLQLPTRPLPAGLAEPKSDTTNPRIVNIEALVARYLGDRIMADVERELAEFYGDPDVAPLSAEERDERLRELKGKLMQAEREEAAAYWEAVAAGEDIVPRADIHPAAFLGVA